MTRWPPPSTTLPNCANTCRRGPAAHDVNKQANDLTNSGEIRRAAAEMVLVGKPGGRYVAAVNTIVGEEVPLENYLAFLESVADAGAY